MTSSDFGVRRTPGPAAAGAGEQVVGQAVPHCTGPAAVRTGPEGPGCRVATTAEALSVSSRTIQQLKRRFVQRGLEAALGRKPRAVTSHGKFEARPGKRSRLDANWSYICWPARWDSPAPCRRTAATSATPSSALPPAPAAPCGLHSLRAQRLLRKGMPGSSVSLKLPAGSAFSVADAVARVRPGGATRDAPLPAGAPPPARPRRTDAEASPPLPSRSPRHS